MTRKRIYAWIKYFKIKWLKVTNIDFNGLTREIYKPIMIYDTYYTYIDQNYYFILKMIFDVPSNAPYNSHPSLYSLIFPKWYLQNSSWLSLVNITSLIPLRLHTLSTYNYWIYPSRLENWCYKIFIVSCLIFN